MAYNKDDYEEIGHEVDPDTGQVSVFLRDRHKYIIKDYMDSEVAYGHHTRTTNWTPIIGLMLMFLTSMGAITATWVSMTERVTTLETKQEITLKSLSEQVRENSSNVVNDHYTFRNEIRSLRIMIDELKKQISHAREHHGKD